MTIDAMVHVMNNSSAPPAYRMVLMVIADNARTQDWAGWPTIGSIARRSGCSTRSVQRAIAELEALGELEVVEHGAPEYDVPTQYRANLYYVLEYRKRHEHHPDDAPRRGRRNSSARTPPVVPNRQHEPMNGRGPQDPLDTPDWHHDSGPDVVPDQPVRVMGDDLGVPSVVTGSSSELSPKPSVEPSVQPSVEEQPQRAQLALVAAPAEPKVDPVRQVFDAWLTSTSRDRGRTVLDPKRRKFIVAALKAHPIEVVLDAVEGWQYEPWFAGANDRGTTYNEVAHCLKDSARIEQFASLTRRARAGDLRTTSTRTQVAANGTTGRVTPATQREQEFQARLAHVMQQRAARQGGSR